LFKEHLTYLIGIKGIKPSTREAGVLPSKLTSTVWLRNHPWGARRMRNSRWTLGIQVEHPETIQVKIQKEVHIEQGWIFKKDFQADHWNLLNFASNTKYFVLEIFSWNIVSEFYFEFFECFFLFGLIRMCPFVFFILWPHLEFLVLCNSFGDFLCKNPYFDCCFFFVIIWRPQPWKRKCLFVFNPITTLITAQIVKAPFCSSFPLTWLLNK
jgi:hypothetical protein